MTPPLKWPPLSPEADAALTRLEQAETFDGRRGDFDLIAAEATRRAMPTFAAMLPGIALFVLVYGVPQWLGWVRLPEIVANLGWVLVVPATVIVTNALRGTQAIKDEMRMDKALKKWSDAANAASARTPQ